jgi:zinc and cadmium transporter
VTTSQIAFRYRSQDSTTGVTRATTKRLAAVLGGVVGFFVVGPWEDLFPYLLVVASSSFIYVAVADLLPQLQQRLSWRQVLAQVAWLAAGLALVTTATVVMHVH